MAFDVNQAPFAPLGLSLESNADGITAHAGGTQAAAFQLSAQMNRVTTVGTAADSVKLPVSAPGLVVTVTNAAAANALNVFGQTGDIINALAANTAFSVVANKSAQFICYTAGQWHTLLSA
jgi:hypothetical protein